MEGGGVEEFLDFFKNAFLVFVFGDDFALNTVDSIKMISDSFDVYS